MKNIKKLSLAFLMVIISITLLIGCTKKDEDVKDSKEDIVEEDVDKKSDSKKEESKKEENEEEEDKKEESVDLPKGPEGKSIEKMNDMASEIVNSNEKILSEVKAKNGKDWHDIVFVLSDEFAEEAKSMDKVELDKTLKNLRKEVFQSMGKSGVLNFKSEDDAITVYYEDAKGNEVIDKSVINPD